MNKFVTFFLFLAMVRECLRFLKTGPLTTTVSTVQNCHKGDLHPLHSKLQITHPQVHGDAHSYFLKVILAMKFAPRCEYWNINSRATYG